MISVGIVDDQSLIRAGLRMIVESQPEMSVAGECEDGAGAIELAGEESPDVLLMDIRMPGVGGIEAVNGVLEASPETRIIMLTTFDVDHYVYDSLLAGASGFLLKDVTPERLIDGIRTVVRGDMLLAPSITRRLIEQHVHRPPLPPADEAPMRQLTQREREVLAQIARGLSNAEIARLFHVSEGTVKTHVSRVLSKLGLRDRVQAVIAAYELGFIQPGGRVSQ